MTTPARGAFNKDVLLLHLTLSSLSLLHTAREARSDGDFKSSTAGEPATMSQPHLHLSTSAIYPFDARGVAKRFRHAAIFVALDALQSGETMRFVNDHDPLPLLDQLRARYGERVDIQYQQREPGAIAIDFVVR